MTDDRENRLLAALIQMVEQYLHCDEASGTVDTLSMSAGEHAIAVLSEFGLMELGPGARYGRWTEAGKEFLRNL